MSTNIIGIADFSSGEFDRTTDTGSGLKIEPIIEDVLYPGNGTWRSSVQDLAENGVETLDELVFASNESLLSGTRAILKTRTGAIAVVDNTWENFLPVNGQKTIDLMSGADNWGKGANISFGANVQSGVGLRLEYNSEADEEFIERELLTPVDISSCDFVSFETRSTHSGTNIQLQLASYNTSGTGSSPNVFDTYLLSGNNNYGEIFTQHYWDLNDIVSGSELSLDDVNYIAFKITSGINNSVVDIANLFAGNYLESGTNSIESSAQRYLQYEAILTSLRG